jgi:signal transduction histidine kinase
MRSMRASVFGTAAFRMAVAFVLAFTVGVFAVMFALQWATRAYTRQATDDAVRSEMTLVQQESALLPPQALAEKLAVKAQTRGATPLFYVVAGADGRIYGGNLPAQVLHDRGFGQVALPAPADARESDDETMTVRTLTLPAADGAIVAVGRDTYAQDELEEWVGAVTLWGGVGLSLMALVGGLVMGWLFLRRIEGVNSAAERVMRGSLDERLPTIGFGSEFDRLSGSLNRMLDRLQASMDSLRQVSGDIAHDLRTPLGHLRQRLERARTQASTPAEFKAAMDGAIGDIDEVLAIFASLLRIAQLEGGEGREQFADVDLSQVAERVLDAFRPSAEDSGRSLSSEIEPQLMVQGDAALLGQLLSNLVENAIVHSEPGARVIVSARRTQARAVLAVSDSGPGVPARELGRIARRFYRLDRSRTTPGSGLGLALAAAVAELHGAALDFRDNRPGLRVELSLPAAAPAE